MNQLHRSDAAELNVMFVHRWGITMAGGETWIRHLARNLRGQQVKISCALHTRGPLYAEIEALNLPVRQLDLHFLRGRPRGALITSGLGLAWSGLRFSRYVNQIRPHAIHAFSLEAAEPALLAATLTRTPLVVTVMNCGPYPKLDQRVLRRSDRVIAITSAVAEDVLRAGVAPERLVRIPLGIEMNGIVPREPGRLRRDLGLPYDIPLIGMVANLEQKKAQDVLIRALPRILDSVPDARVILLGRDKATTETTMGAYEAELRGIVRELGLHERVIFAGFRPNAAALIGDLDVSVLCSRREAQGLSAVESMVAGVPMVASGIEGLKEVIDDGFTGLLVDPDDPMMLADAILSVLGDPALRSRLVANAQRVASERFDAAELAARNRDVYETVVRRQRRPVPVGVIGEGDA